MGMKNTSTVLVAISVILVSIMSLAGCRGTASAGDGDLTDSLDTVNGVYYWRTTLTLSHDERAFLKENRIGRVYTRLFDVVDRDGRWMPNGTLIFTDTFPAGVEIVPVVFIDSRAMKIKDDISALTPLLLARVDSMMSKNGYPRAKEIQIDFDWTAANRERYFKLLNCLRDSLHRHDRKLSATIRLHQLSQPVPPVDYGVLMVYNMGNFRNPNEVNSIISVRTLKEYLPRLKGYTLVLRAALPIYSWNLLFRNGEFIAIARDIDLDNQSLYTRVDSNHYRARSYMPLPAGSSGALPKSRIYPGDIIRVERSALSTLDSVLRLLEDSRSGIGKGLILYHLDQQSINNYNHNDIQKIYYSF